MNNNLPEGWRIVKLGEIMDRITNMYHPSKKEKLPYIGLEHIEQEKLRLIGHGWSNEVQSSKYKFQKGDILFGKLRPYFRKVWYAKFDGVCSTDIFVIRAKNGTDPRFLFYRLASWEIVDAASKAASGTKMPRVSWEFLANLEIPLPPLPEQRKIAEILGSLDDKIELNIEMNKTLEEIAKVLFKYYFVDFEPFKDDLVYNEELGNEIPRGWEVKSILDIAKFINGRAFKQDEILRNQNKKKGLPIIKIPELKEGITSKTDFYNGPLEEKYIAREGDILFSWSATIELAYWPYPIGAVNQHIFKVIPINVPKWFVYHWVEKNLSKYRAIVRDKATTMGHIQRQHLKETLVLIPPTRMIEDANKKIKPLHDILLENMKENLILSQIRDTLLPKLLSGEIRVKINEIEDVIKEELHEKAGKLQEVRKKKEKQRKKVKKVQKSILGILREVDGTRL